MVDQEKSKQELINELVALRQQVAKLETELKQTEKQRNQLLRTEREQRALAEALCQTGTALVGTFNREEALDRILEQISRVVPHDAASIILLEQGSAHVSRWRGYAKTRAMDFVESAVFNIEDIRILRRIQDTCQPLAVPIANSRDEWLTSFGKHWVKSYAIAPILSRGRTVGFLGVDSETPDFFEQTDAKYLQAFADQAAVALEHVWLYEQARLEIMKRVKALRKERNFVSAVLDTVGALVVVLDTEGRIVSFNRACEQIIGFSLAEVRCRYFWELFLIPQEIEPVKAVFEALKTGQFPIEYKSYWRTRAGSQRLVAWTNTVLFNPQGTVEYIISTGLDITEHQQTEAALRENERKYRSLTDQLPIGVYRATADGKILHANPALAHIFGYKTIKDLLKASSSTIFGDPFERRRLFEHWKTDETTVTSELKCRTKKGRHIWIRNTGRIIRNHDGETDHIGGTIEDITERKLAEEALRRSEERFRQVISSISDHIYVTETTESGLPKVIYLSPHVEALTGYPWEKFVTDWRSWLSDVIHPEDRVIAGTHMAKAIMGTRNEVEYRLIRADGTTIWVRDSVRVESRPESKIIYGVVSDITKRKRAEEALVAEQERLAVTLRSINDGVISVDAEGQIVLANPVARTYLAEMTTADFGDVLTRLGNHPLETILANVSETKNYHEVTIEGPPQRIFEVVAQPMDASQRTNGWVLIIRDVTEKKAVQERIHQQERLAAVGQLAAGIAHDFNNILTSIIGIAELLSDSPDMPQPAQQDLKRIAEQGQRAAHLTRQILDFGRRSISEKRPLDLDVFLKETFKLLTRTISENIHINLEFEADEYSLNADPTQIQQVLTNLAINAQDAMPGGGELKVRLSRFVLAEDDSPPYPRMRPGDWLSLSMADNGMGIAPEHRSHLFEPFFTTKEVGKGTGLGLAQVYGIVQQHEGHIDVESQLEVGTTFIIYLPALPRMKKRLAQPATRVQVPQGQGEVILLVEDNSTVLAVTQSILERLGYQVLTATNGQNALEVYGRHQDSINLVLTDVTMPEMGGLDLCKALRARNNTIRVVAMTGYPLLVEAEEFLAQGIVGWLSKPLSIEKVAQEMSQALRSNGNSPLH
jgi:PAS domain S-box-containing protein